MVTPRLLCALVAATLTAIALASCDGTLPLVSDISHDAAPCDAAGQAGASDACLN